MAVQAQVDVAGDLDGAGNTRHISRQVVAAAGQGRAAGGAPRRPGVRAFVAICTVRVAADGVLRVVDQPDGLGAAVVLIFKNSAAVHESEKSCLGCIHPLDGVAHRAGLVDVGQGYLIHGQCAAGVGRGVHIGGICGDRTHALDTQIRHDTVDCGRADEGDPPIDANVSAVNVRTLMDGQGAAAVVDAGAPFAGGADLHIGAVDEDRGATSVIPYADVHAGDGHVIIHRQGARIIHSRPHCAAGGVAEGGVAGDGGVGEGHGAGIGHGGADAEGIVDAAAGHVEGPAVLDGNRSKIPAADIDCA